MALAGGRSICRSARPPSSGASCTDSMRTAYGRGCATRYLALLARKTSALSHDTGLRRRGRWRATAPTSTPAISRSPRSLSRRSPAMSRGDSGAAPRWRLHQQHTCRCYWNLFSHEHLVRKATSLSGGIRDDRFRPLARPLPAIGLATERCCAGGRRTSRSSLNAMASSPAVRATPKSPTRRPVRRCLKLTSKGTYTATGTEAVVARKTFSLKR